MKMVAEKCLNGQDEGLMGQTAAKSLKEEFEKIKSRLPDDWREQMKEFDAVYQTVKGDSRLTNIRSGRTAPTLREIQQLQKIAGN